MRSSVIFVTIITCVIACDPSTAQESPVTEVRFLRTKNGNTTVVDMLLVTVTRKF